MCNPFQSCPFESIHASLSSFSCISFTLFNGFECLLQCFIQNSQVLKFPKREISEMLAGDCAKVASVLCFLCRKFVEICTSQIAGNAPSSPPFCFFHAAC